MRAALAEPFPGYEVVEPPKPWKSRFGALFLDALDAPGPEFEWLISGWLTVGDKSIIAGPSQSGKSFLAIHAGMCVSFGHDFFGCEVKQGLVIYIAGEGARGVKKRLRAWRKHFKVEYSRETPFVLLQTPVNLYASEGSDTAALIAEIKGIGEAFPDVPLRMVVVDTLATASVGAEENSARDMSIVMSNVNKINEVTRAHVALVHHMSASGTKMRGSTAIYAALDNTIYVTCSETKVRTAKLGKQKDEEDTLSFQFELMRSTLGEDANGKAITSCVCLPVGEKEAIYREEERRGWRLSPGEEVFMRAFFDADKRCGAPVPASWDLPPRVRSVVAYDDVKRAYAAANPSDSMKENETEEDAAKARENHREALRKKLTRVREALTGAGVVAAGKFDGKDFVWWTGKPLRAFPQTLPQREPEQLPLDAGGSQMEEIPF